LNPLRWKREHQIAFFCAAALGCLVGLIVGIQHVSPGEYPSTILGGEPGAPNSIYLPLEYWMFLALWAALGGAIGAGVIYIRQLLRT
jgi:hypothetical protein